eukprot:SAG31_NODE_18059_length_648_cov_0.978142_2_plen_46_part_01
MSRACVAKVLWCLEELKLPFELVHASAILGPGASMMAEPNPDPRVN